MAQPVDPILIGSLAAKLKAFLESPVGKWTVAEFARNEDRLVVSVNVNRSLDTAFIFSFTEHGLCKSLRKGDGPLVHTLLEPDEFLRQIADRQNPPDLSEVIRHCIETTQRIAMGEDSPIFLDSAN